jgi:ubiquinone/menaquinone biosynthesis C-methylase UbiE
MLRGVRKEEKLKYSRTLMGRAEGIFTLYGTKYFVDHFSDNNGRLLDVGCGAGYTLKHIRERFNHVDLIGLDISAFALRSARKDDKKTSFIRGDAEHLPIRTGSLDYTTSFNLLEHLPEPMKAMEEHYRVLKKHGIFYSLTPCEGEELTIHGRSRMLRSLKMKHFGHIQHFTKRHIHRELKKIGFEIVDEGHSFFYFSQLIELAVHLFTHLTGLRMEKDATRFSEQIGLVRAFVKDFVSRIDLKLSNRFPHHSKGYYLMARK